MPSTETASGVRVRLRLPRRLEGGDPLAQHGDEVAHHVRNRIVHAEEVGIQVPLRHLEADLAGQTRVQLVLGDGFQHGAAAGWPRAIPGRRPC